MSIVAEDLSKSFKIPKRNHGIINAFRIFFIESMKL